MIFSYYTEECDRLRRENQSPAGKSPLATKPKSHKFASSSDREDEEQTELHVISRKDIQIPYKNCKLYNRSAHNKDNCQLKGSGHPLIKETKNIIFHNIMSLPQVLYVFSFSFMLFV